MSIAQPNTDMLAQIEVADEPEIVESHAEESWKAYNGL